MAPRPHGSTDLATQKTRVHSLTDTVSPPPATVAVRALIVSLIVTSLLPTGLSAQEGFARLLDDSHQAIQRGRFDLAGEWLGAAKKLSADFPANDSRHAELLEAYGVLYRSSGGLEEAVEAFENALQAWSISHPFNPRKVALCANNLGVLHDALGNFPDAERYLGQALELWSDSVGASHPDRLVTLRNLAVSYRAQGKYEAAEREYRRALEARQRGPRNLLAINEARKDLADVLRAQKQWQAAGVLYMAIAESLPAQSRNATAAQAWLDLADMYRELGDAANAERLYTAAIGAFESLGDAQANSLALAHNNLGVLLGSQERYAEAEAAYASALELWGGVLAADHPFVLRARNNLGAAHLAQGEYTEAEEIYASLLAQLRQDADADSTVVAELTANLASIRSHSQQAR